MAVWHWMYDHPEATPAELKAATLDAAREVWNRYYAPVFHRRDVTLLAVYSHLICEVLYLPDYPVGHMIGFQIEEQMKKAGNFGAEFERMAKFGNLAPDLWMKNATGAPVGPEALLRAADRAPGGNGSVTPQPLAAFARCPQPLAVSQRSGFLIPNRLRMGYDSTMRPRALGILTLAAFWLTLSSGEAGQPGITPRLHPWGRFDPGAWKLVRVVTETLNERGQVVSTSTADTRTTLVDLDDDGVTLEVQACVEVAGKRFQAEPQTVKQGFHGELAVPNLKLSDPVDGQVVIEDRKIACKVYRLETVGAEEKTAISSLLLDGRAAVHPQAGGRHHGPGRQERAERDGRRGDRPGHARAGPRRNPQRELRQDGPHATRRGRSRRWRWCCRTCPAESSATVPKRWTRAAG